jgi:nucleolar protein 9
MDISKECTGTTSAKHNSEDAHQRSKGDSMEDSKVQGALILQSLLRLNEPHCMIVTERWVKVKSGDI